MILGQEKFMKELRSFFEKIIKQSIALRGTNEEEAMDIDLSYSESAEGDHMEIDSSTNAPLSDSSPTVTMLSSSESPRYFTIESSAETLNATSQSQFPKISFTDWCVPTSTLTMAQSQGVGASRSPHSITDNAIADISPDDSFPFVAIAQSSLPSLVNSTTMVMECSLILLTLVMANDHQPPLALPEPVATNQPITTMDFDCGFSTIPLSNSNGTRKSAAEQAFESLSTDCWVKFERWLEGLDSDITMSGNADWKGLHVNLSNNSFNQSFPKQQTTLTSASLASSPLDNNLLEITSITHEPHTVSPLTSLVNLLLLSPHEQLHSEQLHNKQQHDERSHNGLNLLFPQEQHAESSISHDNFQAYPNLLITHKQTPFAPLTMIHSDLPHAQQPIFDPLQPSSHLNISLGLDPNTFVPSLHLDYSMCQQHEDVLVLKAGVPCAKWKGYAILDWPDC